MKSFPSMGTRALAVALATALFAACASGTESSGGAPGVLAPVHVDLSAPLPKNLSAFNFFHWDRTTGFTFNEAVVPYELNVQLFSDHALKQRAVYVPPGMAGQFQPDDAFDFPVGTVFIKNFYFPADFRAPTQNLRLIETRLLIHYETGWQGWPYIWDAEQKDAVLSPAGEVTPISFIDPEGLPETANYLVPQHNQCVNCHAAPQGDSPLPPVVLLGAKARYLNRDYDYGGTVGSKNQLTHLADLGQLQGLPPLDSFYTAYDLHPYLVDGVDNVAPADVPRAARDYLDINCAHCHKPNAIQGATSQLFLNHDNTDVFHLGVCKRPGSAGAGTGGLTYDIVSGNPDQSILYFRINTEDVGAMMPLIGRSITDKRGVALVRQWIQTLGLPPCQ